MNPLMIFSDKILRAYENSYCPSTAAVENTQFAEGYADRRFGDADPDLPSGDRRRQKDKPASADAAG